MCAITALTVFVTEAPVMAAQKDESAPAKVHPRKVLFLGNSITLHGPKEDIGWTGNWGMAATAEEKDYVHLVTKALTDRSGAAPETLVKNIADFERQYATFDINAGLKDALDFKADLVILAIGENVAELTSPDVQTKFKDAFKKLIETLQTRSHPRIVVRSCFPLMKAKDAALKQAADETGVTYVDLSPLTPDESNYARSERTIAHSGVGGHPGDKGMQRIAEAILKAIE
ncbi:MAG: SGNH/GDSL hydrolase family protein [Candidatus Hydrogenedentes bacterium]|nr:SGNH/GDSL hydrolase family protein [Candidatus Hydrogenedentota bacterium]